MGAELVIRMAQPADADLAADLAAMKRAEYERYSPIFWRRAANGRERHLPFLRQCIASDTYSAFIAERGGVVVGVILASHRGAPPPFHADPEPTWFVDDFYLAPSERWKHTGAALLAAVAAEAHASGAARVIVVGAQRDTTKRSFLLNAGYDLAAAWWVHAITPTNMPAPELAGIQAIVAPAPPVYDPGGPVALALSLGAEPAASVPRFDTWAAASQATLAVIPARTGDVALDTAQMTQGYTVASEWFVRAV
jgi:predicted N-acetyltransferase YhbS